MKWNCNGITTTILSVGMYASLLPIVVHGRAYNQSNVVTLPPAEVGKQFLNEPCLAVVEENDFEPSDDLSPSNGNGNDDGNDDDDSWLYCETPGGYFYRIPTTDPAWIETMVQGGQLVSGVTELDLPPDTMVNEDLGTLEWKDDLVVAPDLVQVEDHGRRRRRRRLAQVTGTKTVLSVRVTATDQSNTFDEPTLRNEVFGAGNTNLKTQFEKCSFGQLLFVPTSDRKGQTASIVGGVVTIAVEHSTTEGDSVLRNAVTTKLKQEFGVSSPSELADHVMYCLPSRSMVGIAYAYINSWLSVYKDVWGLYVSAQMHEVGHNLNLAHATDFKFLSHGNARSEYDDKTGLMGYSYNDKEFPKMCFNPAKSWQLKWYENKQAIYTPTCGEVTMKVGSIIDYEEDQVETILLQISQSTQSLDYYLTYNARTLFNRETQEGGNKLVIDAQGGNGSSYSKSTLEARLEVGESFEIQDFNGVAGDTVVVQFIERGGFSMREATITIVWVPQDTSICPTNSPSDVPSRQTTLGPSEYPTRLPSRSPTQVPSAMPTGGPSSSPTMMPSAIPTSHPTPHPTQIPSVKPTSLPTMTTSVQPTVDSSGNPTGMPTQTVSESPSAKPSILASNNPTTDPTMDPTTLSPTSQPTMEPSEEPTGVPSEIPTPNPSSSPSNGPSVIPTSNPSIGPSSIPTSSPTTEPTRKPSVIPTPMPSLGISKNPSIRPSITPTASFSLFPTMAASEHPTIDQTDGPTQRPTNSPTLTPTFMSSSTPSRGPTLRPTKEASDVPTGLPTTEPTARKTANPTDEVTILPSESPTEDPTSKPTAMESDAPTEEPTRRPTIAPSQTPTGNPTITSSENPTRDPTARPTAMPSKRPTPEPTVAPSSLPTPVPTARPTLNPSTLPTMSPSVAPSKTPSKTPTNLPTLEPTLNPTPLPTSKPSVNPSLAPTAPPSMTPSINPTLKPTTTPSINPSFKPSIRPVQNPITLRNQTPATNPDCRRWYWFMIPDCKNQGI